VITKDRYTTVAALDRENREFWPHQWVCVGNTLQLANSDDFLTATVGGKGVVVQNFDGEIRAFTNVCSHRFNRLQTDRCGNRSLVCRYHGWGYDADGLPNRIPSRPRFDNIVPSCHALERWDVRVCGTLVFVSLRPVEPLECFLGEAGAIAEAQSLAFGELIDTNVIDVKCNWKLFVENTLEGYHVPWVHPSSIMRLTAGSTATFGFHGRHSSVRTPVTAGRMAAVEALFSGRTYEVDDYRHLLIWPNTTLATTKGMSFALQLFEPVSPGETRFTSLVFSTDADVPAAAAEMFGKSVADLNRQIFAEDAEVCQHLQQGVADAATAGILSDEEDRVRHFHDCYMRAMP
jgi:phenylpropionate dioxygenase-like ring-hydroxylating dioxygenase large terminal subunit